MTPQVWWLIARATGVVAYALLTASILVGLALAVRARRLPPAAWLLDLHRFVGGLAVVFTLGHVAALLLDDFVEFRVLDVLVGFTSSWRPTAVVLGVVALHLLLAVELTSLVQRRLPRRVWYAVHLTSAPAWALVSVHTLLAGTDAQTWPVRALLVLGTAAVLGTTAFRLWGQRGRAATDGRPRSSSARGAPST